MTSTASHRRVSLRQQLALALLAGCLLSSSAVAQTTPARPAASPSETLSPGSSDPLFANPPLLYGNEPPNAGVWPYATPPLTPRGYDSTIASRPYEPPIRLPQDDPPEGPYFLPPAIDDDRLLIGGPKVTEYKEGFFQKFSLGGTWLPSTGSNALGIVESEIFLTVALPAPTPQWPLLITPYLNIRSLDGPQSPDLPPELYETYVDFLWVPRLAPRLLGILAITPSIYSDFEQSDDQGFRWQGKGLVRWDVVPEKLQLMVGVLYLNRVDLKVLPAGGLIWRPNDNIDYQMIFPRPKLGHRLRFGEDWSDWFYVAGEFGGNSFSITRADGSQDIATLRDWRVILGVERRRNGGAGMRFEVGYVFNRQVEYVSDTPDFFPSDTLMMRLVGMY